MDEMNSRNPLIGDTDGDTIENVREMLAFLCRSCEGEDDQGRGLLLSLQTAKGALGTVNVN